MNQKQNNTSFTSSNRLWISSRLLSQHFSVFRKPLSISFRNGVYKRDVRVDDIAMLRMPGHRLQWSILGSVKNTRTKKMGGSNGNGNVENCSFSRCGITFVTFFFRSVWVLEIYWKNCSLFG